MKKMPLLSLLSIIPTVPSGRNSSGFLPCPASVK